MSRTAQHLVREIRSREHAQRGDRLAMRGFGIHTIREFNRLLVLNSVLEFGPIARVAIAHRTGLSRTTVSSIVDALIAEGFVREGSMLNAAPSGGRRAIELHFNADAGYVIGVAMGRSHLAFIATNLAAEVVARNTAEFSTTPGPEASFPVLIEKLRAFVEFTGLDWKRIIGIGVGVPSPLDAQLEMLVSPPRMPGWSGVNIRQRLQTELSVPVYLDNDANMGALGESRYGAGRNIADLAYINIGSGIGGGLVLNGHIYRGAGGSAGEIGHVTLDEEGPVCDCGNIGCLETLAGTRAIIDDARTGKSLAHAALLRNEDPAALPPPALRDRADAEFDDVTQAARANDPAALTALERAGERIGMAVATLINLFNPSVVLVDGRYTSAGELLLEPLRRTAAERSLPVAWARTRIQLGALGQDAIGLGAVTAVLDAAFRPPAVSAALSRYQVHSARSISESVLAGTRPSITP